MKSCQAGQKTLQDAKHLQNCQKTHVIMYVVSQELVGVRISTFSVGPDRTQTNILEKASGRKSKDKNDD